MAVKTSKTSGKPATAAAPAANGNATSAPATAPPVKEKKEPKKRVPYGGERYPDDYADEKLRGQLKTKLTSVPTDFDPKTQLPPSAKDFADKATFFDWRAQVSRASAVRFEALAKQERELGDSAQRAEKKRLLSLTSKVNDLKANLLKGGMTEAEIQALIASVVANAPQPAAEQAAS